MPGSWSLRDETAGEELLDGGSEIMEIMWHMDDADRESAPVSIFDHWEHHGLSGGDPPRKSFDSGTIIRDMDTLIAEFARLDPQRRWGALSVSAWIDGFAEVREHATDDPDHEFRSMFFD